MDKRGLNEIVTTTLIILLIVASVGAIWAFVLPALKSAGGGIQKANICITNDVSPVSCQYGANGTLPATINYRVTSLDTKAVASIEKITPEIIATDSGALGAQDIGNIGEGVEKTSQPLIGLRSGAPPQQAIISTTYKLADGSKTVCKSSGIQCSPFSGSTDISVKTGPNLLTNPTDLRDTTAWTLSGLVDPKKDVKESPYLFNGKTITLLESTSVDTDTPPDGRTIDDCYQWVGTSGALRVNEYIAIDPTKTYEFSIWINQTAATTGYKYLGFYLYDTAKAIITVGNWGNPYFWSHINAWNGWQRRSGFLFPSTTDTDENAYPDADKVSAETLKKTFGTDYAMHKSAKYMMVRFGYCYASTAGQKIQLAYPEIREVQEKLTI